MRPWRPTPGLFNRIVCWLLVRGMPDRIPMADIDHEVEDGDVVPVADGLHAIHVPGHCAGQLAFLWHRSGGILFPADAAVHVFGLRAQPLARAFRARTRKSTNVGQPGI